MNKWTIRKNKISRSRNKHQISLCFKGYIYQRVRQCNHLGCNHWVSEGGWRDIISPTGPGSFSGPPTCGTWPEYLPGEASQTDASPFSHDPKFLAIGEHWNVGSGLDGEWRVLQYRPVQWLHHSGCWPDSFVHLLLHGSSPCIHCCFVFSRPLRKFIQISLGSCFEHDGHFFLPEGAVNTHDPLVHVLIASI